MNLKNAWEVFIKGFGFQGAYYGLCRPPKPINFTFSVTNSCHSQCRSCHIWKYYIVDPKKKETELKPEEVKKVFQKLGHVFFMNISGGEPFEQEHIVEYVKIGIHYLTPAVVHIPTNAILTESIVQKVEEILSWIKTHAPGTVLQLKPSYDGVGKDHDYIRGIEGNYKHLEETLRALLPLKKKYSNFHLGLGTVVSRWNVEKLNEIIENLKNFEIDTYITEVAEERVEMDNEGRKITPNWEEYKKGILPVKEKVRKDLKNLKGLKKLTQAMRLYYYDLTWKILKEKRQILPCLAGITSAQMDPYGNIWPCAVLGHTKSMGNVRDWDYDFLPLWHSPRAKEIRKYIYDRNCHCPLANQSYSNILYNPFAMAKVALTILKN